MIVNYHQLHGQECSSVPFCSPMSHYCGSFPQNSSSQLSLRASASSPPDSIWYPDSGATNHITPKVYNLTTAFPYISKSHVTMGNGESVSIANVGSSTFLASSRLLLL